MAIFGKTDIGASLDISIQHTIMANRATAGSAGTLTSITAYLAESSTNNGRSVKAALYDDSDNLVAESDAITSVTTNPTWHTFSFSSPPAITATTYKLAIWAAGGAGNLVVAYDASGGDAREQVLTYGAWPDPATFSSNTRDLSIYATYTAGGENEVTPTDGLINASGNISTVTTQVGENTTAPTTGVIEAASETVTVTFTYNFIATVNLLLTVNSDLSFQNYTLPSSGSAKIVSSAPEVGLSSTISPSIGVIEIRGTQAAINQIEVEVYPSQVNVDVVVSAPTVNLLGNLIPETGLVGIQSDPVIVTHGVFIYPPTGTINMVSPGLPEWNNRTWVVQPQATATWTLSS